MNSARLSIDTCIIQSYSGQAYLLVSRFSASGSVSGFKGVEPLQFFDFYSAHQFLKRLETSLSFWRRYLFAIQDTSGLNVNSDEAILEIIAVKLVKQKILLYALPQLNSRDNAGQSKSYQGREGRIFRFSHPLLVDTRARKHCLSFANSNEAQEFVNELNIDARELQTLNSNYAQPHAVGESIGNTNLAQALADGRLVVLSEHSMTKLKNKNEEDDLAAAAVDYNGVGLGPPTSTIPLTWFSLKLVDEVGESVSGVDVNIVVDNEHHTLTTDGSGTIKVEQVKDKFSFATIADAKLLRDKIESRWQQKREVIVEERDNLTRRPFTNALESLTLKHEKPHTLAIIPPRGKLLIELLDKAGQPHRNFTYQIEGPEQYSGEVDENRFVHHDDVVHGNYSLKFSVVNFKGTDYETTSEYKSPSVVVDPEEVRSQKRRLGHTPTARLARIIGSVFSDGKSFLLPTALTALKPILSLLRETSPVQLLIVGHTDASGNVSYNEALALERAQMVKSYLEGDVDTWLQQYENTHNINKRWSTSEDLKMLNALPDFITKPRDETPVRWFQWTRNLTVDNNAGPKTRRQLIFEYMQLHECLAKSSTLLPCVAHGAGPHKPLGEAETAPLEIDVAPSSLQRRVDFFIFDRFFGVKPAISTPAGPEYDAWVDRADPIENFIAEPIKREFSIIEFGDINFATDREIILPQMRKQTRGSGLMAENIFRFAIEFFYAQQRFGGAKQVLIAGHTDTMGSDNHNLQLSERRALNTQLYLSGDRSAWAEQSFNNATTSDYQHILTWVDDVKVWFCDPGGIDDKFGPKTRDALRQFKYFYNQEFETNLPEDGIKRVEDWLAFYDIYDQVLANVMNISVEMLNERKQGLIFIGDKILACGEHQPFDQPGHDAFESQANRRVDLLFFDENEIPDLNATPPGESIYNNPELVPVPIPDRRPQIDAFFANTSEQSIEAHNLLVKQGNSITLHWRVKLAKTIEMTIEDHEGNITVEEHSSGNSKELETASSTFVVDKHVNISIAAVNEFGTEHFFRTVQVTVVDKNGVGENTSSGSDSISEGVL